MKKRKELPYFPLSLLFAVCFIGVIELLGVEPFYGRLMVPIGDVLGLQLIIYELYTKRYKKGFRPNVIGLFISLAVHFWFFRKYDISMLREQHLALFMLNSGLALFTSLTVIHYTLESIYVKKSKRKFQKNNKKKHVRD